MIFHLTCFHIRGCYHIGIREGKISILFIQLRKGRYDRLLTADPVDQQDVIKFLIRNTLDTDLIGDLLALTVQIRMIRSLDL